MKSSSGQYFEGLDHVRALAAFLVFAFHFMEFGGGDRATPPVFPLSLFTEGHTGVAIFMTLSGYLFAKLLNGRNVDFPAFLWNRFLRLAPLLVVVVILAGLENWYLGTLSWGFAKSIVAGALLPTLPNGGWSITVEAHFYLILPLLLVIGRRSSLSLLLALLIIALARVVVYELRGEVQTLAYWTLVGRADQFILGMVAFQNRKLFADRHILAVTIAMMFLLYWYWCDLNGSLWVFPSDPSRSPIWIIMPTIEGAAYGSLIAWYDNSSLGHGGTKFSRFFALIGTYSYSIYLLHYFFVFRMPAFIDMYFFDLSNRYVLMATAIPCFLVLLPLSYLSYRFIEAPFLAHRRRYLR